DANYAEAQYQWGNCLFAKAQVTADGKVNPVPGTAEAFQKYLELAPNGPNAESAKGMLAAIGGTVDTKYANPNAPAEKKKRGSKKRWVGACLGFYMIRWLIVRILGLFVMILIARSLIVPLIKECSQFFGTSQRETRQPPETQAPQAGGELKKDPVCGT